MAGLDSSNVNTGPRFYLFGVRFRNLDPTPATGVTATWRWLQDDTTCNLYDEQGHSGNFVLDRNVLCECTENGVAIPCIQIAPGSPTTYVEPSVPGDGVFDFYFGVQIARDTEALDMGREYVVEINTDQDSTIQSTPMNRQIYVQPAIDQNRNSIVSLVGLEQVEVGSDYVYELQSTTTGNNGWDQFLSFPNFPSVIFQVIAVEANYTIPLGLQSDTLWTDACGLDRDISSSTYRQCIGPEQVPTGKIGGDASIRYTVRILTTGDSLVKATIIDESGNSYHYNQDFDASQEGLAIEACLRQVDAEATALFVPSLVAEGVSTQLSITVTNNEATELTGLQFLEVLPGTELVYSESSSDCGATVSLTERADSLFELQVSGATVPGNGVNNVCTFVLDVTSTAPVGIYTLDEVEFRVAEGCSLRIPTAALTVCGASQTDVTATQTVSPSQLPTEMVSFFEITISTVASITGVHFETQVPAGLSVAGPASTSDPACGTITLSASGVLSVAGGAVEPGTPCSYMLMVESDVAASYVFPAVEILFVEGCPTVASEVTLVVEGLTSLVNFIPLSLSNEAGSTAFKVILRKTTFLLNTHLLFQQITINNPNPFDLTGLAFDDPLPSSLVLVSDVVEVSQGCTADATFVVGTNTISVSNGVIPAMTSCIFQVTVDAALSELGVSVNPSFTIRTSQLADATTNAAPLLIFGASPSE